MDFWILKPLETDANGWPWGGMYDTLHGCIVYAADEYAARHYVHDSKSPGDEGRAAWLDGKKTSCVRLSAVAQAGVILHDFCAG